MVVKVKKLKMLDQTQIQELLQQVAQNLKDNKQDFHLTYGVVKDHADEISVHAEGVFPAELMGSKYPSESDEEFNYRKANYQAVTRPFWGRALNSIQRIWNPTNYSIELPGDSGEVHEYLFKDYPTFKSITKYFAQVVTPNKINYPNSVLAIRPKSIPLKMRGEEIVIDESKSVEPISVFYHSDDVYEFNELFSLVRTAKRSMVDIGGQKKKEGVIMELYDNTYIYKITQIGKKNDWSFDVEQWYQHNLGHVPVYLLEGEPRTIDGHVYYMSYFEKSLDFLNKVVCQNSTLDATTDKNAYATRVYYESDCDNPKCGYRCNVGYQLNDDGDPVTCGSCKGTGKKTMFTPMRDYTIDPKIRVNEEAPPFPPLTYVSPGTEILEWLDKKIRRDIEDGFAFMNIDVASKPNGQTATAAKIDREELFSFLLLVSQELFMLLGTVMDDIIMMRYGKDIDFTIRPPDEFTIRDSQVLTEEIETMSKLNVSPLAIKRVLKEWTSRRFNDDSIDKHILDIVYATDAFTNTSRQEMNTGISNGTIQKWQQVLHDNIYKYIDKMIRNDENIDDIDDTVIKLEALAKTDTTTTGTTEDILNGL